MVKTIYIEDIFIKFFIAMSHNGVGMHAQDINAAASFYQNLIDGDSITEKQGAYILKILNKYNDICAPYYDYRDCMENPLWKKQFRIIDNRKMIWVEKDEHGSCWICMKFPFDFKQCFDEQIGTSENYLNGISLWDKTRRIRKLFLYDFNLVHLIEFCKTNGFEIMDSAVEAQSAVEEIWNNQDQYLKASMVRSGSVILSNAVEDTEKYFQQHKTNEVASDLLLAKSLGHCYTGKIKNVFERIAASKSNVFHMKNLKAFLDLCHGVSGKIIILLDKSESSIDWVKFLKCTIDESGYSRKDFRICFRTNNKTDPQFNSWVNQNDFGGKISDAKFLIFRERPAKWLFKDQKDVTIVASNDLLPGLNASARSMLKSHPCVIYVGEYKPVKQYGETIVEL
jgi:hypothetical protein